MDYGKELGIGKNEASVGKAEIQAFSPSLYEYISHLHIAVAGFIAATSLATAGLVVGALLALSGLRSMPRSERATTASPGSL